MWISTQNMLQVAVAFFVTISGLRRPFFNITVTKHCTHSSRHSLLMDLPLYFTFSPLARIRWKVLFLYTMCFDSKKTLFTGHTGQFWSDRCSTKYPIKVLLIIQFAGSVSYSKTRDSLVCIWSWGHNCHYKVMFFIFVMEYCDVKSRWITFNIASSKSVYITLVEKHKLQHWIPHHFHKAQFIFMFLFHTAWLVHLKINVWLEHVITNILQLLI